MERERHCFDRAKDLSSSGNLPVPDIRPLIPTPDRFQVYIYTINTQTLRCVLCKYLVTGERARGEARMLRASEREGAAVERGGRRENI